MAVDEELLNDIEPLQYNWNIISLCYDLWKEDIKRAYNGMEMKLHKIAGVGENYIPNLCKGERKETRKIFNCESSDTNILKLLQGERKISFRNSNILERKIREYIVLNNIKRGIDGNHKHKVDASISEKELIEKCGTKDYKGYISELKQKIENLLEEEDIRKKKSEQDTFEYTSIGLVKQFLLGKNVREDVILLGEEETYISEVLTLLLKIKTDKLAKLTDKNLDMISNYVETLYNRVMAEVNYRKVKQLEKELSYDVTKAYSDAEHRKYVNRSKQEDSEWE